MFSPVDSSYWLELGYERAKTNCTCRFWTLTTWWGLAISNTSPTAGTRLRIHLLQAIAVVPVSPLLYPKIYSYEYSAHQNFGIPPETITVMTNPDTAAIGDQALPSNSMRKS